MPFEVKQIEPLDLQESVAIGVSLPFESPSVFTSTYESKDAIKTNIVNYMLTNRGERYFNPNFGADIRAVLFENINQGSLEELKDRVETDITNYFPRVAITNLELTSDPDTQTVRVYMKYRIKSSNIQDEILINIQQ